MKVKVSELSGSALDWAVAKAHGVNMDRFYNEIVDLGHSVADIYVPSTNWDQGGPIIERTGITVGPSNAFCQEYGKFAASLENPIVAFGDTPLIAAMRCFVKSKLGESVEIPDQLC